VATVLVALQHRHRRERSSSPHSPTNLTLPPAQSLSCIGAQDKVSYKPEEIIHAMAIDKEKALYCSNKPI
jgi:hypothetical protein